MNVLCFSVLAILCRFASSADWCYQSQVSCNNHSCIGPDDWASVATTCGNTKQSPINIVTKKTLFDNHLTPVKFTGYQDTINTLITNNGHTVQVNLPDRAAISGANLGDNYKAQQLHLHWGKNGGPGSEHTIDGEKYPMELHIVHIKEKYNSVEQAINDPSGVAVLGFFYEESQSANKKYDGLINSLKNITHPGTNGTLSAVSLDMLILPHNELERYFRYQGSLTTPGCSEAVVWTIFEKAIPLSKEQLSAFSSLMFSDGTAMVNTYRPIQLRAGREVYYSRSYVFCVSTALLVSSVFTSFYVLSV
ncbi:carbonic anhydrase 4b isoform X2 [Sinocyclocheilus anshuiensis]|uniref:Carbonic anhydrase n=1 Tax=Sinocyclocheilus anshuiensis TaxID=1608454 RepID=A0A671PSI3_9TELE|nr:PREDICTED: carbonic anhydrase 4-like isoform X2 [Sinocyclocheilus anshuiensis]